MTVELDSDAVAGYLAKHPRFFEEHAELLGNVRLSSTLGGRTVSLQERQMEVLREKIKALELRMASLFRLAEENDALNTHFQDWTCALLSARNDVDLPHVLVDGIKTGFGVPFATLRIWNAGQASAHTWYAAAVSADTQIFASSLQVPYCGANNDFEAVQLLDEAEQVKSVALVPLRASEDGEAFGLLILASDDAQRFTSDMATDFLNRIGRTAAAALTTLLA